MARGVRIARQQIEDLLAIVHATAIDLAAENRFQPGIVKALIKHELRIPARLANGPAGKGASHLDDILLRVSAVHAKRVQLHQLAAIVFVEPAVEILVLSLRSGRGPGESEA